MITPFFSIITSTFNAGKAVNVPISSIRDQYRDDVECIIIDGASTDDTLEHIEKNRDVVTQVVSEPDTGIYDALNKGINLARGTLIGIIGSDDCLIPGSLSALAQRFSVDKADIYAGETLLTDPNGRAALRQDEEYGIGALVSGIPFGHNAMFASKEAYNRIGLYDTSYRITADANWVHRAIRAGLTCSRLDRVLVHFAPAGVSSTDGERVLSETGRTIRENFPFLSQQEALDLLFGVRGWAGPHAMADVLASHSDRDLHASVREALKPKPAALAFIDNHLGEIAKTGTAPAAAPIRATPAPLVSFIIPAYNVAGYIGRCLDSLTEQQNVAQIEIIVVDDGSQDETASIVHSYMAHDKRIKLIQQPNQGQGAARAVALSHATGKYVWCIDSDDRIQAGVLDRLLAIVGKHDDLDVLVLNFAYEEENGHLEYSALVPSWLGGKIVSPLENEETFAAISSWNCPPWRYFIRRAYMEKNNITFHAGLFYEDHPFALDVIAQTSKVYVDTPISYYYLRRAGSTVRSLDERCLDFIPIRRFALDRLAKCNLLERFPAITCSYAMPIEFVRALVPAALIAKFMAAVWKDMTPAEIDVVRVHGSPDEVALLRAGMNGKIADANVTSMSSSYSLIGKHLEISRTLKQSNVKGLGYVEGPYPDHGLPDRFHWVYGRKLRINAPTTGVDAPHLVLRLRNYFSDQVLMVAQNEKTIEVFPCRSTNINDYCDLIIKLVDAPIVNVEIELAQGDCSPNDLSVILDRIEIVGAHDLEDPDFDVKSWAQPERIVTGLRTRLEGVHVDVRVDPQPRSYLKIGSESQISGTFVFERGLGDITIGDRSSIGGGSLFICSQEGGIHIGDNVMLSWNVTVIDSNSHSIDPNIRMNDAFDWLAGMETNRMGHYKDWSCVQSVPIRIHDGAWIGFGSTIMKGVTIGKGAVVGSNSVVTKDVPPGAIVAGNPARIVAQTHRSTNRPTHEMSETHSLPTQAPERVKIGLELE